MPFFITEQKVEVIVGDHEIPGVRAGATLSSIEAQVGRDRGDGGAKEGDSMVRLDADGAEEVLRELEDGVGQRSWQRHPLREGSGVLFAIREALADPGD